MATETKKPSVAQKTDAKETKKVSEAHAAPKAETKTSASKEAKPKVEAKTETKKDAKGKETKQKKEFAKKKFIPWVEKKEVKKSNEAYKVQQEVKADKKWHPVFRGRFGKKNIRRKSIAKWDKWRKPHGIDLDKGLQHGFRPKIGYGNRAEFRGIHPSGYREVMVCNVNDLGKINPKVEAARISRTVGKRKRNEIITKANEKSIRVLN